MVVTNRQIDGRLPPEHQHHVYCQVCMAPAPQVDVLLVTQFQFQTLLAVCPVSVLMTTVRGDRLKDLAFTGTDLALPCRPVCK